MRRIIAFDGIDCIGKSYVIRFMYDELLRNNYIPYVFHLTGPDKDYKDFFIDRHFGKLSNKVTDGIIQWEKFIQLYTDIKTILCASTRNVILLDRTPYSENIWNMFFGRKNNYENNAIMLHFLKIFKTLNEEITFVNLDVDSRILTNRILLRDEDCSNYVNAFDRLFGDKPPFRFDHDFDFEHHRYPEHDRHEKPDCYPEHDCHHRHHACKPQYYYGMKKEEYERCRYDYEHHHDNHDNHDFKQHHACHEYDTGKILFMINVLKEEFNKLFILLRKYNIDVVTYCNNSEHDIEFIINDIFKDFYR